MFRQLLKGGAREMGVSLTGSMIDQMIRYQSMLLEANRTMNLTRITDADEAVRAHFLDSLAPLAQGPLLAGVRDMVDIGSGAGFPGIPISIARPDIRVVLIDSLKKRVLFLQEVIDALSLNCVAMHMRAEDAAREEAFRARFDLATARAVAGLSVLMELSLPFLSVGGRLIAYKGPSVNEELVAARRASAVLGGGEIEILPVVIPGRPDWAHCLATVKKCVDTPGQYPRRAGEPNRNPLGKP